MTQAYSVTALNFDSVTLGWSLRPGYDLMEEAIAVEVRSPDRPVARVMASDGTVMARGLLREEETIDLVAPDGTRIELLWLSIGEEYCCFLASRPLLDGLVYLEAAAGATPGPAWGELVGRSGLAEGTVLATDDGPVAVEWLRPGDRLLTRDNGFHPIVWIGRGTTSDQLEIAPGAFAPGLPAQTLKLSGSQRVLVWGAELELLFGEDEALCPAWAIGAWPGFAPLAAPSPPAVYQLLLPRHEVILADGLWVESLFLEGGTLDGGAAARLAVRCADAGGHHDRAVRPCLHGWEGRLLHPIVEDTPAEEEPGLGSERRRA